MHVLVFPNTVEIGSGFCFTVGNPSMEEDFVLIVGEFCSDSYRHRPVYFITLTGYSLAIPLELSTAVPQSLHFALTMAAVQQSFVSVLSYESVFPANVE